MTFLEFLYLVKAISVLANVAILAGVVLLSVFIVKKIRERKNSRKDEILK